MRRTGAAAAAVMLMAGTVGAEAPVRPWTGFFVGAGLGAGAVVQTQAIVDFLGPLFSDTYGATGPVATVTAGYDVGLAPKVVAGAFVDFDLSRMSNDSLFTLMPFEHERAWSLGARLGYLASPAMLWYGFGGYTQSTFDFDMIGSTDLRGFMLGGGLELRLGGSWSLRGEYRYAEFQTEKLMNLCGCTWLEADASVHSGRALLIYRFGSAGPAP
jgi:outer membrane immunogenic protein